MNGTSFSFATCIKTTDQSQDESESPSHCSLFAGFCSRCIEVVRSLLHHPLPVAGVERWGSRPTIGNNSAGGVSGPSRRVEELTCWEGSRNRGESVSRGDRGKGPLG